MKIEWAISEEDIRLVKSFVGLQRQNPVMVDRHLRNLAPEKPSVDEERFWRAAVCMRLTSRQKSGPKSAVCALSSTKPFPLSVEVLRANRRRLRGFIRSTLSAVPGMRDYNVAAEQFAANFRLLETEGWQETLDQCNRLTTLVLLKEERAVVRYIAKFDGIGPKQARNILQALGLTRYEIPLDSRVIRWLKNQVVFPLPVSGALLADPDYYEFVLDCIQELCRVCDIHPCILDAAIFGENEQDGWTEDTLRY
jgi:hypothetical protein